jgi:predicted branched-subunit amino acid permease
MKERIAKLRWILACFIMTDEQFSIVNKALPCLLAQTETRQKLFTKLKSLLDNDIHYH